MLEKILDATKKDRNTHIIKKSSEITVAVVIEVFLNIGRSRCYDAHSKTILKRERLKNDRLFTITNLNQ